MVFEINTRKVTNIVGKDMEKNKGHYNAERRLNTILERMNENYDAAIVPAGSLKLGDTIPDNI